MIILSRNVAKAKLKVCWLCVATWKLSFSPFRHVESNASFFSDRTCAAEVKGVLEELTSNKFALLTVI